MFLSPKGPLGAGVSHTFTQGGPPVTIGKLDPESDQPFVLEVFRKASDYIDLEFASEPTAKMAQEFLEERPPSASMDDKCTFGFRTAQGQGAGVLDLCRGYPEVTDLYIGLLMLAPEVRNGGLGHAVIDWLADWAAGQGFRRLLTGPIEHNVKGRAFWKREGFSHLRTVENVEAGNRSHNVHVVARELRGA